MQQNLEDALDMLRFLDKNNDRKVSEEVCTERLTAAQHTTGTAPHPLEPGLSLLWQPEGRGCQTPAASHSCCCPGVCSHQEFLTVMEAVTDPMTHEEVEAHVAAMLGQHPDEAFNQPGYHHPAGQWVGGWVKGR